MKIKIHDTTYIFLLISFISGYFEYIYLLLLIIFIHEMGHYIFSLIVKIKLKNIIVYPLGAITILDSELNIEIYKEFIVLIGGIIFQLIFWLIVYFLYNDNLITTHVYNLICKINILLISFNFMPILPLDGGKLLNIILDYIVSYYISLKITIIISYIFSILFLLKFKTLLSILIFIYLIKTINIEYKNIKNKYLLFLYERYINEYNYKKIKYIKSIKMLYRNKYNIITYTSEKKYLNNLFTKIKK